MNLTDRAKVLFFDIESTHLKANFGYCICFGYKYLGDKKPRVLSITDHPGTKGVTDDSKLMVRVHDLLSNHADIIVSYYGKEFDRKFLNTRMMMAGLPPLPPLSYEHVDLYYTARHNLALHSNRLASVAEAVGCPFKKTDLKPMLWVAAMAGDKAARQYIIEHCARDVDVLEYCYKKLRPYIRTHPPVGQRTACHSCGSFKAQLRGYTIVKAGGRKQRKQCTKCGAWRAEKVEV